MIGCIGVITFIHDRILSFIAFIQNVGQYLFKQII